MLKLVENQAFRKNIRDFLLHKLYEMNRYEFSRETANLFLEGALMIFKDEDFIAHLQECILMDSSLDKKDSMDIVNAMDEIKNVLVVEE